MKLYKNTNNEVFAYDEDGSQDHLIGDKISITKEEFNQIQLSKYQELSYVEKRQSEYPSVFDYIDGIVKGDNEQINKYISDCLAVKSKYPKE
jgi:hypothetical protein